MPLIPHEILKAILAAKPKVAPELPVEDDVLEPANLDELRGVPLDPQKQSLPELMETIRSLESPGAKGGKQKGELSREYKFDYSRSKATTPLPDPIKVGEVKEPPRGPDMSAELGLGRSLSEAGAAIAGVKPISGLYDSADSSSKMREAQRQADIENRRAGVRDQLTADVQNASTQRAAHKEEQDSLDAIAKEKRLREERIMLKDMGLGGGEDGGMDLATLLRLGVAVKGLGMRQNEDDRKTSRLKFNDYAPGEGGFYGGDTEAKDFRTKQAAVKDIHDISNMATSLAKKVGTGHILPDQLRGQFDVIRDSLQYVIKDREGFGALQQAEIDRLNKLVQDPNSFWEFIKSGTGLSEFITRLETLKKVYQDRQDNLGRSLNLYRGSSTGALQAPEQTEAAGKNQKLNERLKTEAAGAVDAAKGKVGGVADSLIEKLKAEKARRAGGAK